MIHITHYKDCGLNLVLRFTLIDMALNADSYNKPWLLFVEHNNRPWYSNTLYHCAMYRQMKRKMYRHVKVTWDFRRSFHIYSHSQQRFSALDKAAWQAFNQLSRYFITRLLYHTTTLSRDQDKMPPITYECTVVAIVRYIPDNESGLVWFYWLHSTGDNVTSVN